MSVQKIQNYLKEYSYLKSIQALLHWDMETMMPKGAIEDRAQRLSYVSGKIHAHLTAKKYTRLLEDLEGMKLKPLEKKLLKELKWDHRLMSALPAKHVQEIGHAQAIAGHAWADAKKANDWEAFLPHLKKLVELKRREARFYGGKLPYDSLLKLHDKEFSSKEIGQLFSELKLGLAKLVKTVKSDGRFTQVKDLKGPFDLRTQEELNMHVARLFGLPERHSRLDVSAHPFSINISPQDQRITTRYFREHLDSLSSTMHEVGHALYEMNLPREWEGTPFQEAISLSMHESQSRFWENVIGRSREFCQFIHPEISKRFPQALKGIGPEELYLVMNKSEPGLIRVESSELYYNYHIIIRYEIEEQIFNHSLEVEDIPELWNSKYQEHLGIKPKNHAQGVLQDSHWSGGAFGYFPTYALGNLISGSLWVSLHKSIPKFDQKVARGEFHEILNQLKERIHSKGRSSTTKEIIGELKVNDYLRYLQEKFRG